MKKMTMIVACCMTISMAICTSAVADLFRVDVNNTPVYANPSAISQQIATVQSSDILSAESTSGWTLVMLPDGRKGWVRDAAGTRMSADAASGQPPVQTPVAIVANPNAVVLQQLFEKLRKVAADFVGRNYAARNFRRDLLAGFRAVLTGPVLAEYTRAANDPETDFDSYLGNLKNCSVDNVAVSRATSTQIDATGTLRVKVALARAVEDNGGGIAEGGNEQNYAVYLQFAEMQGMTVERMRALVAQYGLENLVAEQVNRTTFIAKKEGQAWKISKMDLEFQGTRLLTKAGVPVYETAATAILPTAPLAASLTNTPVAIASATAGNVPVASGTALGTPIVVGQAIAGMFSASDLQDTMGNYYDVYSFSGREGERVYIRAVSEACNIRMLLKGPNGFQVADNRYGSKTREIGNQLLPAAGTYTIVLTGANRGTSSYRIRLDRPGTITLESNTVIGQIGYGRTVFGQLANTDPFFSDGSYYKAYRFEGRRGTPVVVQYHSSTFKPWIAIVGPDGFYKTNDGVRSSSVFGVGANDISNFAGFGGLVLPADGTYTIITSSLSSSTGFFGLRLENVPVLPDNRTVVKPVTLGQWNAGTLANGDDQFVAGAYYDVYSFEVQAGKTYEWKVVFEQEFRNPYKFLNFIVTGPNRDMSTGWMRSDMGGTNSYGPATPGVCYIYIMNSYLGGYQDINYSIMVRQK